MVKHYPSRIAIDLEPRESRALKRMARQEFRWARDQARWLIAEEAKRRGLWEDEVMEIEYYPSRIYVNLEPEVSRALVQMARQDSRHPRDQARWLIAEEAKRRGLWEDEDSPTAEVEREAA